MALPDFPHWYDRQGRPISIEQAEALLRDIDARRVAFTTIGAREVSTVHLVLDQSLGVPLFGERGVPLIFETMTFPDCDICERTATEAAALAMHDQVCAQVRDEESARKRG